MNLCWAYIRYCLIDLHKGVHRGQDLFWMRQLCKLKRLSISLDCQSVFLQYKQFTPKKALVLSIVSER